eukprot:3546865-Alexandrium_andersonii.AAC.1
MSASLVGSEMCIRDSFYEASEPVGMETGLEEVAFCIYEDHNSGKWHKPRGNMGPFRDVFGQEHRH